MASVLSAVERRQSENNCCVWDGRKASLGRAWAGKAGEDKEPEEGRRDDALFITGRRHGVSGEATDLTNPALCRRM